MAEETQNPIHALHSFKELVLTRFDSMDKAVRLLQEQANREPSISVVDERLHKNIELIHVKFAERDIRDAQSTREVKDAVDTAFQSQKEAIAKAEGAFTKQIENITTQINTLEKTVDDKINSLKDRVNGVSGIIDISQGEKAGGRAVWVAIGAVIGAVGALVPLLAIILPLIKGP